MDINGTMIGTDSTDTHSLSDAVIEYMARNIIKSGKNIYDKFKEEGKDYKKKSADYVNSLTDPMYITMKEQLTKEFSKGIFQSVIKLLSDTKDYQLILRTFGLDGQDVINQLQTYFPSMTFIHLKSVWIDDVNYFQCNGQTISTDNLTGHLIIQDDYNYWNEHERKATCGKLLFGEGKIYGFDDNDCMHGDGKIFKVNTIDCALKPNYFMDLISD